MCIGPIEVIRTFGQAIKEKPVENTLIIAGSIVLLSIWLPAGYAMIFLKHHASKHGYYNRLPKWL